VRNGQRMGSVRLSRWSALPLAAVLICAGAGFAYARQQSEQQQDQQNQQQQSRQQQTNQDGSRNPSTTDRDPTSLTAPSTLSDENLARVAASADEITDVLKKDPGLLVELKRWIAANATNHGQVVDDDQLSDGAIFDRLKSDAIFRGVATRLLQRYGYLTPTYARGSDAEQQHTLQLEEEKMQMERANAPASGGVVFPYSTGRETQTRSGNLPSQNGLPQGQDNFSLPSDQQAPTNQLPITVPQNVPGLLRASDEDSGQQQQLIAAALSTGSLSSLLPSGASATGNLDSERYSMNRELTQRSSVADAEPATPYYGSSSSETMNDGRGEAGYGLRRESGSEEEVQTKRAQPVMQHQPNPFSDIPSLYDLYQKASAQTQDLQPFGMTAIHSRGREQSQLPMDLPAGPDYVLGPGDSLYIDMWGSSSQRIYRVVDREGKISLPEAGPIEVSGRTMGAAQTAVQQALRSQFRDISADLSLARLRTVRVYVVGEVRNPGGYDISSLSTPLNALITAGGTTSDGSLRRIRHMRGNQLIQEVDVYDLLLRGVRDDVAPLEPGDTLQIPITGPRVTIEGMVRRPAIYELRDESNLSQALTLAGGVLPTASLRHIEVERVEAHEKRTVLSVDIPVGDEAAATKQLEGFKVNDGDVIRILSIAPATQDAVYLQGHVLRPGRYSYKDGMRVTDMISSYSDLMPEPDTYAEIIRLAAPDFRPEVEAFNLSDALANPKTAPKLEPLDTIRVYSKYDFENVPAVFVGGEVRKPGNYRTTGEIHLRDAVYQAGGLTPDASLDSAQLIRYNDDGSLRISPVNLGRAMEGDPLENLVLRPRDRLMIQRKRDRVDPPTVYIRGEVAAPGRFPLTSNLTVRDLIALGGGLKRSAFTGTADITRYVGSDPDKQFGEHFQVNIAEAMAGDSDNNITLHDGDVLTIAERPGWGDVGATVMISGEVTHPGTYGIKPGERLSSLLARAGYFLPTAYPQAAIFERKDVRDLQEKTRQDLIAHVEQQGTEIKASVASGAAEQIALQQAAVAQRQRVLEGLERMTVTGRMVVHLTPGMRGFAGSPDDIELRNGDTLFVPKKPEFVIVSGQVYNANAMTYEPRRNVAWYLSHAGGITSTGDKKAIFVVRADGSVISGHGSDWWSRNIMSVGVNPGDSIIVPEKPINSGGFWRNLIAAAQIAESASVSALALQSVGL
jgi:polysaccharide biosynthesis/export protein